MKITLEKEKDNVVKMDISVPAKDAQAAYDNALRRFAQYVNIDGFRKGKAPKHLIERQIGTDRIKVEAIENLMPQAISTAVKENELDLIAQPYISKYDYDLGNDLKIIAHAEIRPEVKLGKYKGLKIEVADSPIPADAFDKSLNNLLNQYSTEGKVKGRAAKNTDIAVIDFDGYVGKEKIQGGEGKDYSLDLGNSNFIPGFAEAIVGHKSGEEFDINVTFPKTYHDEKLKGQAAVFKIKIHELKEKKLPELNDEFAKKAGPFKNVQELKDDINKFLENQRENINKQNSENEIFKTVVEAAKMEVPTTMIERETASLVEEYKARLAQQGISWEMFLQAQSEAELTKSLQAEAANRIRNSLVIDKIAKEEKLTLEAKDLERKFQEISAAYGVSPNEIIQQFGQNQEFLASVSQQALNDKVRDFLMTSNTVVLKEGKKPAKTAAKSEAKSEAKTPAKAKAAAKSKPAAKTASKAKK